jgi:hypothetical protein
LLIDPGDICFGQAAQPGMGVLRQSPERTRDAREKQIEDQHERQGLQQQAGGLPGSRRDWLGTAMQPDQGAVSRVMATSSQRPVGMLCE